MWRGIHGEVAAPLDGNYYRGSGFRGGCEREIVYWVDDMQNTTGTLSPGAHPGSYNGQDAYNDMLVCGIRNASDRALCRDESGICSEGERPQGCNRPDIEGGEA